jgi:hypothetical protein
VYDVSEVLARIDDHLPIVIALTLVAWVCGFVQIVEALRLGRRDSVPGAPIVMTAFLFAHDATFVARYDMWFNVVGHWYFQVFWFGMFGAVAVELLLIQQFLVLGHRAIAPNLPRWAFTVSFVLFQIFVLVALWWIQALLDDPLTLVTLTLVSVAAVVPLAPWILTRGSTRGQSRLFAWAALLGPGSLVLGLTPVICAAFDTISYYAVVVSVFALAITYLALLEFYRRNEKRHGFDGVAAVGPAVTHEHG